MSWLIIAVLLGLWVLGMLTSTPQWGGIHVLPVVAAIVLLFRVVRGPPVAMGRKRDGIHAPFKKP